MKSSVAFFGFLASAFGQLTRPFDSAPSSDSNGYEAQSSTASNILSTSQITQAWPQRVSELAATVTSSAGAPFTFGNGVSDSSTTENLWGWATSGANSAQLFTSGTDVPFTFGTGGPGASLTAVTTSVGATNPVATTTSDGKITTHAPTFFSTTRGPSSTSSTISVSAARATYTGSSPNGKEVAYSLGAVAAGLALAF